MKSRDQGFRATSATSLISDICYPSFTCLLWALSQFVFIQRWSHSHYLSWSTGGGKTGPQSSYHELQQYEIKLLYCYNSLHELKSNCKILNIIWTKIAMVNNMERIIQKCLSICCVTVWPSVLASSKSLANHTTYKISIIHFPQVEL